jgi:hypothetical protein
MNNFFSTHGKELRVNQIAKISEKLSKADASKFKTSLELAKEVLSAFNWYNETGKALMIEQEGASLNSEDFAKELGFTKSWMYKLIKVASLDEETILNYEAACDRVDAKGDETATRSIAGLLKYASFTQVESEESSNEGEESDSEEQNVTKEKPAVVFTCRLEDLGVEGMKNVSMRVSLSGEVKTSNTKEEILYAISVLQSSLIDE